MITCCPKARTASKDDVRRPSSRGSRRTWVAILSSSPRIVENWCSRTETSLRFSSQGAEKTQNMYSTSIRLPEKETEREGSGIYIPKSKEFYPTTQNSCYYTHIA